MRIYNWLMVEIWDDYIYVFYALERGYFFSLFKKFYFLVQSTLSFEWVDIYVGVDVGIDIDIDRYVGLGVDIDVDVSK